MTAPFNQGEWLEKWRAYLGKPLSDLCQEGLVDPLHAKPKITALAAVEVEFRVEH
jgi:hypothetical protein